MVCWKKSSTLAAYYDWSDDEISCSGIEKHLAIFPAKNVVKDSHSCTIENVQNLSSGFIEWSCTQCRIQRFFGHTVFLKLKIGYIVPTPPPSNPNCCSWGWVQKYLILNAFGGGYLRLLKRFLFLSTCWLCFIQFLGEILWEKSCINLLGSRTFQMVPKYIWMRYG